MTTNEAAERLLTMLNPGGAWFAQGEQYIRLRLNEALPLALAAAKREGAREAMEQIDILQRKYTADIHAPRVYRTNVLADLRAAKRAILDEEAAR